METSKGYELPSLDGISTPQEAGEAINRIYADAMADLGHPWVNGNHVQHTDFLKRVAELQEIKLEGADLRSDLQIAMEAAVEKQDERQAAQFAEAEAVMDELADTGFPRHSLRQDITNYELALLRMRLQVARGEYDSVLPEIERELGRVNAPPAMHETLRALRTLPGTMGKAKEQLAETLLLFIQEEKRKKFGRLNMP